MHKYFEGNARIHTWLSGLRRHAGIKASTGGARFPSAACLGESAARSWSTDLGWQDPRAPQALRDISIGRGDRRDSGEVGEEPLRVVLSRVREDIANAS